MLYCKAKAKAYRKLPHRYVFGRSFLIVKQKARFDIF